MTSLWADAGALEGRTSPRRPRSWGAPRAQSLRFAARPRLLCGVFGVGLGASQQKRLFLPDVHTDFIFALVGEELGLIGTLGVITLFLAFCYYGIRAAERARDDFSFLVATGIVLASRPQKAPQRSWRLLGGQVGAFDWSTPLSERQGRPVTISEAIHDPCDFTIAQLQWLYGHGKL